jgi:hypothetical protein
MVVFTDEGIILGNLGSRDGDFLGHGETCLDKLRFIVFMYIRLKNEEPIQNG